MADKITPKRQKFLDAVKDTLGDVATVTRKQVVEIVEKNEASGLKWPSWLTGDRQYRAERGVFRLPDTSPEPAAETETADDGDKPESTPETE